PGHGDELTLLLLILDEPHLGLGRGLGEEVVDARLFGDRTRRAWVVTGDHDRTNAHRAKAGEPLLDAALDHVFQMNEAQLRVAVGHRQRCAARVGDDRCLLADLRWWLASKLLDVLHDRVHRAFSDLPPSGPGARALRQVASAHPGVRRERDELRTELM